MAQNNFEANQIIQLDQGWNQIKEKALDVLEDYLDNPEEYRQKLAAASGTSRLFPHQEYVSIYTTCYQMATQRSPWNFSKDMYDRHGETMQNYLVTKVLPSLRDSTGVNLLKELKHRWENHKIMNKWLSKFLAYLDRYHVKHHQLPTLHEAGLKHFKEQVYESIKVMTSSAILEMINQNRTGMIIDTDLVKKNVEIFEAMGMGTLDAYRSDLERPLIEATQEYYNAESQQWIQSMSTPEYLVIAEEKLLEEKNRVNEYLNPETEQKLITSIEECILDAHVETLLNKPNSGLVYLLENDKLDDIQRMFNLLSRLEARGGLDPMAAMVQNYVLEKGKEVIQSFQNSTASDSDTAFISSQLELHDKYLSVVRNQCSGNSKFQKALKDAFVDIVNSDQIKNSNTKANNASELLSAYCDRLLKGSAGEKLVESELETRLEKCVQLFNYLTEKDMFAEIYRQQLAKRLLGSRSVTIDLEKYLIAKLKLQCGTQFTSKMEGMLNDLAVGSEHKSEFKNHLSTSKSSIRSNMDFNVQVLTTGFWPSPSHKNLEVNLPGEMSQCIEVFKHWHDSKHSKRKLTYVYTQGSATISATYGKRKYTITVTTLQAIALHTLNGGETFTFTELAERLNLPTEVMKPLMHSLSCGRYKVVTKSPKSNKINETDTFQANADFKCPQSKFRIPMAALDTTNTAKRVEEDRTHAIEASIVRTMKARKTLPHQQLTGEVYNQLAFFRPSMKSIKKAIESLIERQYLERSAEDSSVYNYLA